MMMLSPLSLGRGGAQAVAHAVDAHRVPWALLPCSLTSAEIVAAAVSESGGTRMRYSIGVNPAVNRHGEAEA